MRVLVQRVRHGAVHVGGETVARIGPGVVLLVGVTHSDTPAEADWLAKKVAHLRIFEDEAGKMNRSLKEVGGEALVVSQFTLYADPYEGRRPSLIHAAPPEHARPLIERFAEALRAEGIPVQTGVFGAHMLVEIHNDGPVTIWLERSATGPGSK
ncbi:D-aminoacyl-tRNA deacylase [Thermoflexus sp.]|uniref:D-aminoacyl-tRNA deacylase n=1 Tax=Thermoflexus sp. TaxID=1969742 RepID=UPI0025F89970|nr:D-aminoacyl-tRNA deacylase [Thermoflexus sp.]MDW8181500.1 D-aminoacyl-tRNA deacylase [Anaerolineae bacterium]MCS6962645.1 D-aminoacyl-tRNA deacylase [Thermoflexus sp.]MCS7352041.1 D-aminoacyl-tRNA deacylase [Thermoflexus sp.]MCX7690790.1 D-aminoacyl-tRNA deacylase [Thermoflexus sp.]MDW8185224.1 D-aminoacyl-tRNA deacylase [Anaerolineae bacterium]